VNGVQETVPAKAGLTYKASTDRYQYGQATGSK